MEHLTYHTDAELDRAMHERGLHFYREYFLWGTMPAYRNPAGTRYRFVDRGDLLTPRELYERLLEEWRPAGHAEQVYASTQMRLDLLSLEHDDMRED